jgi:hypothetical protein
MEDESIEPPENFKLFYKEKSFPSNGTLSVWLNNYKYNMDVPFSISRTGSLKGQIFSVGDLVYDCFKEGGIKKYSSFLNNFTVFTRWYSLRSTPHFI